MDKAQIKCIIESCGYAPRIARKERHSSRAPQGSELCYVYAVHNGRARMLGKFDEIAQMDEDGLRMRITEKFAQSTAQRGRH